MTAPETPIYLISRRNLAITTLSDENVFSLNAGEAAVVEPGKSFRVDYTQNPPEEIDSDRDVRVGMIDVGSPGGDLVRISFNPSQGEKVNKIKLLAAALINESQDLNDPRCAALARTAFEEGAMWAVKAATAIAPTD